LTDNTRMNMNRTSRQDAVKDAIKKAIDYASAVGKEEVRAESISDTENGHSFHHATPMRMMQTRGGGPGGGPEELSFEPEDVELTSSVTVKFIAE
ncbi:hypothetical protein LTS18_000538, partial [Coniosporium uncinatum]